MKEPKYTDAIKHSWSFVWHYKILWGLGVLAMFVGQFGLGDFIGKIWMSGERLILTGEPLGRGLKNGFFSLSPYHFNDFALLWFLLLCLIIVVIITFVGVTSQGALVAASAHESNVKNLKNVSKFWHVGVKYFWKVLLANIIEKVILAMLLVDLVVIWRYVMNSDCLFPTIALTLSLGFILFFAILVSVLFIYTVGYIVIDDKKMLIAFKDAYRLFSRHILVSIELSVILLLMGILLVLSIIAVLAIFYFPSLFFGILAGALNSMVLLVLGVVVSTVLFVGFIILASGLFNAFTISTWTYMFVRMHKEGLKSRIVHALEKLLKK